MVELVLILVTALHLAVLNIATAGPLVCLWLEWRDTYRGDQLAGVVGRRLAGLVLVTLTLGLVLGGLMLLLMMDGGQGKTFFQAAARIPARRYWFGVAELVFFYAVFGVYFAMWDRWRSRRWLHRALAVVAATNLIYHFPPLFAAIAVLSHRPEAAQAGPLDYQALLALWGDAETLARTAHFLLASLAVTGAVLMGYALGMMRQDPASSDARRLAVWGGWTVLAPTALQLLVGLILLVQLPTFEQSALMGGDLWTTSLFAASLLAALGVMHQSAAAALGAAGRRELVLTLVLMAIVVVLMTGVRHRGLRSGAGAPVATHAIDSTEGRLA